MVKRYAGFLTDPLQPSRSLGSFNMARAKTFPTPEGSVTMTEPPSEQSSKRDLLMSTPSLNQRVSTPYLDGRDPLQPAPLPKELAVKAELETASVGMLAMKACHSGTWDWYIHAGQRYTPHKPETHLLEISKTACLSLVFG